MVSEEPFGGYTLDAPIQVRMLFTMDPVPKGASNVLRDHGGPKSNVHHFYNYFETQGGYSKMEVKYFLNDIWHEKKFGTVVSAIIKGGALTSTALDSVQNNLYNTHVLGITGQPVIPPGASGYSVTYIGRMVGDESNHDTVPWYASDSVIDAIQASLS